MLKNFSLILVLILCSNKLFSQSVTTKESFINSIRPSIVDSVFTKYYLDEDCHMVNISMEDLDDIIRDFPRDIDTSIYIELIKNAQKKPIDFTWNCNDLQRAVCVNSDSIKIITGPKLPAPVYLKKGWSKKRIQKETEKQLNEQKQAVSPQQEKMVFAFSQPVFSNNGEYALLQESTYCGGLCGGSCVVLYKKTDNHWKKIGMTLCWIN